MFKRYVFAFFALSISFLAGGNMGVVDVDSWKICEVSKFESSYGDYFVADLDNGVGYIANDEEKVFTAFPLLSGQRRNVCYLGMCYFGATPEKEFVALEENVQGDRITFGESGEFLRLFDEKGSTHYGIHGHKYFEEMLATGVSFKSMGCIIVADDVLDVIEGSFVANVNALEVTTKKNLELTFLLSLGV